MMNGYKTAEENNREIGGYSTITRDVEQNNGRIKVNSHILHYAEIPQINEINNSPTKITC